MRNPLDTCYGGAFYNGRQAIQLEKIRFSPFLELDPAGSRLKAGCR